jgi:hypothetical protein
MVSKRLSIYGLISAAALVSGVMAGCGGTSSSAPGANAVVNATGGVAPQAGNAPPTASSPAAQQVQVTVGGTPVFGGGFATLPANETIGGAGIVCLIPGNPNADPGTQPFINGMQFAAVMKHKGQATAAIASDPGDIYVDGQPTGVFVNSSGGLSGFLILTPGNHTIAVYGPFTLIDNALSGAQLTVTQFQFGVTVNPDGIGSIPSSLTMKLPANGGHLFGGYFVKETYPTPDFTSGQGSLILTYGSVTKAQTKTINGGIADYSDPFADASDALPGSGVASVTYNYILPPAAAVVKKH